MSHKIDPYSLRLGIIKPWKSRWFIKGDYKNLLEEDFLIRKIILGKIKQAGIVDISIERTNNLCRVNIKAAKPGLIIGRGGKGVEDLTKAIEKAILKVKKERGDKTKTSLSVNIEELRRTDIASAVVARQIAEELERRMPFRRTIKKQLEQIMQNKDVKGAKIMVGGRLDGAEIARSERLQAGSFPLQTLRADIDYVEDTAMTTYGTIGIKVWIYKGEVFEKVS